MDIYFILWIQIQHWHYFVALIVPALAIRSSLESLYFCNHRMLEAHLCFYLPQPYHQPLLLGAMAFCIGEWFKI